MKTIVFGSVLLLFALLLVACEVSVSVEPDFDEEVTATTWTQSSLAGAPEAANYNLAAGESIRYRVSVNDTQAQSAIYFELDDTLELTVYDSSNSAIASSTTADFFRAGTLGLSSQSEESLEASDITAQLSCRGSCVIDHNNSSRYFVRVRNGADSPASGNLYVLLRDFEDTHEAFPGESLPSGGTEGALETLGDEDVYSVPSDGQVSLDVGALASGLEYRLDILSAGNVVETLRVGDPAEDVFAGEEVRIYAENGGTRAAASGKSRYIVSY